jgi:hypothetical protein
LIPVWRGSFTGSLSAIPGATNSKVTILVKLIDLFPQELSKIVTNTQAIPLHWNCKYNCKVLYRIPFFEFAR